MTTVQSEIREAKQFVGGAWVDAANGETFDDLDPFTGDVVARVPAGTRADAGGRSGAHRAQGPADTAANPRSARPVRRDPRRVR